ncbi:hypothetical protein ABZT34_40805 [Streptomyces sp. NPDC005329]|uniref:hypothetical protein n=1 Tax=Streptomyces sp. NPDC005329 TaxID=3157034 RepID=UPI0033BF0E28
MASEPDIRAGTAAQPEPTTVQRSMATWPRGASTTGTSSSPSRSRRPVSMTSSAMTVTALPWRGVVGS